MLSLLLACLIIPKVETLPEPLEPAGETEVEHYHVGKDAVILLDGKRLSVEEFGCFFEDLRITDIVADAEGEVSEVTVKLRGGSIDE